MTIIHYKLRQPHRDGYLTGYASAIEIGGGRILLRDRRVPLVGFAQGQPAVTAKHLGDLELEIPADATAGWAAWGYPTEAPAWWELNSPI